MCPRCTADAPETKRSAYPKLSKEPIMKGDLGDPTPVPVGHALRGAVATAHAYTFGQDLFKFRSSTTCYESPNQRQRIVVEVRLQEPAFRPDSAIA